MDWSSITHLKGKRLSRKHYETPSEMCKYSVMIYLDYVGVSPVEIRQAMKYSSVIGSVNIQGWKNRMVKYKTIRHLLFELLNLEYEKFFRKLVI